MRRAIPPLAQYALMAWSLVKHRNNFTTDSVRRESEVSYYRSASSYIPKVPDMNPVISSDIFATFLVTAADCDIFLPRRLLQR
jgi:hypothetical protein